MEVTLVALAQSEQGGGHAVFCVTDMVMHIELEMQLYWSNIMLYTPEEVAVNVTVD